MARHASSILCGAADTCCEKSSCQQCHCDSGMALWSGALAGLTIMFICVLIYSLHTRAHYDDLDVTLQSSADHVLQEYVSGRLLPNEGTTFSADLSPGLAARLYSATGQPIFQSLSASSAPTIDVRAAGSRPSQAPYDAVAGLAPPLIPVAQGRGVFGVAPGADDVRWRLYILAVESIRPPNARYLVMISPLDRLDASIEGFRRLILLRAVGGAIVSFATGWLVARRGLRPVAALTRTAEAISLSGNLGQRVPGVARRDELGQMASTFNKMLGSVEQAYQAQQRFVSGASHELRAPLTAIQGNLELLERRADMLPAERQEAVNEASREARRLARLVADLLALARADAGVAIRKERVEMDRVLLEALASGRHLAQGQNVRVAEMEPVVLQGDADRLKQMIIILIDNAIRYTPPGGQVTLSLRRRGAYGEFVEIVVQDTGIGIAPQDLPHLFERFYRVDPARSRDSGGTGLGLSIGKWIADQHGGEIFMVSSSGEGTTATIRLPITSGQ